MKLAWLDAEVDERSPIDVTILRSSQFVAALARWQADDRYSATRRLITARRDDRTEYIDQPLEVMDALLGQAFDLASQPSVRVQRYRSAQSAHAALVELPTRGDDLEYLPMQVNPLDWNVP